MTLFEITANVARIQKDGTAKKQTEKYIIEQDMIYDALMRGEEQILAECGGRADMEVVAVKKTKYTAIVPYEDIDKVYDAKIALITTDEKTGKEKCANIAILASAADFDEAKRLVVDYMNRGVMDYKVVSITETAYLDIFRKQQEAE